MERINYRLNAWVLASHIGWNTAWGLPKRAWSFRTALKAGERTTGKLGPMEPNVCQVLARFHAKGGAAEQTATKIYGSLSSRTPHVDCRAVTTFLPEIADVEGSRRVTDAKNALRFILNTTAALNHKCKKDGREGIATVEIVAGGLVDRIDRRACQWFGSVLTPALVQARVVKAVAELRPEIDRAGVKIVVELEPGPIFAVSGESECKSLLFLADGVQLQSVVDLNLDLAHWLLAGVQQTAVDKFADRIGHVHVAGYGIGHLGDIIPLPIQETIFRAWLLRLRRRCPRKSKCGVSLELEAARSSQCVNDAFSAMRRIV